MMTIEEFNKAMEDCNRILKDMVPAEHTGEAVNWGDIHCWCVEKVSAYYGNSIFDFIRFCIEEASPESVRFRTYVQEKLDKDYAECQVVTDW